MGMDIVVCPLRPEHKQARNEIRSAIEHVSMYIPLLNWRIAAALMKEMLRSPNTVFALIWEIVRHTGSMRKVLKNLAVMPKAIYLRNIIARDKYEHIHAHWMSTPATLAYLLSKMTDIPWSMTVHRSDIYENNMGSRKVRDAAFVRVISERGRRDLVRIVGEEYEDKIVVIHVGVDVDESDQGERIMHGSGMDDIRVIVPANLNEVKGHRYLIEAISMLKNDGGFQGEVHFYGEGELREDLEREVRRYNLEREILFKGSVEHDALLRMYKRSDGDLVVILPSIDMGGGEHEGIPVSLMEAMAHRIPVVSTNTGSIGELIDGDCGILVKEKNSREICEAIRKIVSEDSEDRNRRIEAAHRKVSELYSVKSVCENIKQRMCDEHVM